MLFPKPSLIFTALAVLLSASEPSHAQRIWDGNSATDHNWSTGGNWTAGTAPASNTTTSNTATFDNTALQGDRIPNLDSNRSIGGLVFGGTGYTLGSTGGFTLTIGAGRIIGNAAGNFSFSYTQSSGDLLVTAVPEPSAGVMLLAGLGLVLLSRRRKAAAI